MKRDLISLKDLTNAEVEEIRTTTGVLKKKKGQRSDQLSGKSVGLIFQKPSNRTRVSFEVAIWQLGGNCVYLGPEEINLGKRESTSDVAKTLSRFLDGIVARTFTNTDVAELASCADVPVINGLSDLYHPCQALTDILSIKGHFGSTKDITIAFVGDGNNVCHSLMLACAKVGMNINVATPCGYEPDKRIVALAKNFAKDTGAKIVVTNSPEDAVKDVEVIYADTFVSMGQEAEAKQRLEIFKDYQINKKLASLAAKNYIVMHCLPAHRGQEVSDEIIDGKHSIIFDQAENRMHVAKAVLIFLLGSYRQPIE